MAGGLTWRRVIHGWPIQLTLGNHVSSTRVNKSSKYSLMKLRPHPTPLSVCRLGRWVLKL
jgi:hypothetical protein